MVCKCAPNQVILLSTCSRLRPNVIINPRLFRFQMQASAPVPQHQTYLQPPQQYPYQPPPQIISPQDPSKPYSQVFHPTLLCTPANPIHRYFTPLCSVPQQTLFTGISPHSARYPSKPYSQLCTPNSSRYPSKGHSTLLAQQALHTTLWFLCP